MLQYERTDIFEGIDFNKSNKSIECMICHYWYFKTRDLIINHMFVMDVMIYRRLLKIYIIL